MPDSYVIPRGSRPSHFFLQSIVLLVTSLVILSCTPEKHPITGFRNDGRPSQAALTEWQQGRFSMFIHFGLYSLAGGVWNNQPVTIGYSEQIRSHGKISKEEYRKLAGKFNPAKWNPDSVVLLAKAAGMKSVIITAKHHDGFALFKTRFSKFNIADGTPYKADLLLGLADACQRHGLKFGVYFSLIDWDYEGAAPPSNHNSDSISASHHFLNMGQIEELLTGYGKISELWFDMGKPTVEQSRELAALVRKLQPQCMISGRIWNDMGDFAVMNDNASPNFRMGQPWQTPASMFDETWGYRSWQVRNDPQEKATEKLRSLIRSVANGGNYLLNIGPMGDGSVVPFEKAVLLKMGEWINSNYDAVMNAKATDAPEQYWGVLTEANNKIFLFLLNPPADNRITIKGLRSGISRVYIPSFKEAHFRIVGKNPEPVIEFNRTELQNNPLPVLTVELQNKAVFEPAEIIEEPSSGALQLNVNNAVLYHSYSGKDYYSTVPSVIKMEWNIRLKDDRSSAFNFTIPENREVSKFFISVNENEWMVDPGLKNITLPEIRMNKGVNKIIVRPEDQSNPHHDQGLVFLNITIR